MFESRSAWLKYAVRAFKSRVLDILPTIDVQTLDKYLLHLEKFLLQEDKVNKKNEQFKVTLMKGESDE